MRLLFITPGFAASATDLNCIPPLYLLARELNIRGVALDVITLEYPFQDDAYPLVWPTPTPAATTVFPCNGRNRRWLRWRTYARARRQATNLLRKNTYQAIHSFWLGPAWALGESIAAQWNIPHRTTLMGQDVTPGNRFLRRLNAEKAARLVALTPFHLEQLLRATGFRAGHCIPWGVEPNPEPLPPPAQRPLHVLGVGSLLPVKDWGLWLHVIRQIALEYPGLRAELIGIGPEASRLQRLIQDLGLAAQVRLAGEIPRPAVLARMRESRVLLHTARFESFGMVLAEAAAQGCSVVSTPVGIAPALGHCATHAAGLAGLVRQALQHKITPSLPSVPSLHVTTEAYVQLILG
ncbi:MAG: glycosyltransferase [Saprospiraceae bacterium]|nr:glycosyltransferase [Saprospiraceae bacterium]